MNNKTYYHLILDRSGSMADCWETTLRGFATQLNGIKQAADANPDQEIMFSTCIFNHSLEFPGGISPISTGAFPSIEHVFPSGNTALYDAIGESINRLEFAAGMELAERKASVVMVILTDGQENSSTRFDQAAIRRMMDKTRETGLWSYSFIGADFDINEIADKLDVGVHGRKNIAKGAIKTQFAVYNKSFESYLHRKKKGTIDRDFS